jgi:hypothetical protein
MTPPHLQALEEIGRDGIPGLVEVLREEGIDGVRYALWDTTGWQRDYSPPVWRKRATEEQKQMGWEMAVRIEKILCTVLSEALKRQSEETVETLSEGPEDFHKSYSWTEGYTTTMSEDLSPRLPEGYYLEEGADTLILHRPDGTEVGYFSAYSVTREAIERAAEGDFRASEER